MYPKRRRPSPPGEILLMEFLEPGHMTQKKLAEDMGLHPKVINEIIKEKRSITARSALLLSGCLGTSPEFWMNLQTQVDLWDARKLLQDKPKSSGVRKRAKSSNQPRSRN